MVYYPGIAASFAAAGAANPSVIGTPTEFNNSTDPHTGHIFNHSVVAQTELLVVAVLIGGDGAQTLTGASSNLDGALTIIHAGSAGGATAASPGWALARLIPTSTGTHQITLTFSGNVRYSGGAAMNIKDIDGADPIGASESLDSSTDAASASDALTIETANCLLLTFAVVQGEDSAPINPTLGATTLADGLTGGGSTTLDAAWCVAQEVIGSAGSNDYGFTWAVTDGWGIAALEIRTPT